MRIAKKESLVEINAEFSPNVKTIAEVVELTGRTRQYIEKKGNLNFGLILSNKEGDGGYKVVIEDSALAEFINKCSSIDSLKDAKASFKGVLPPKGTKPSVKKLKSLESLPKEIVKDKSTGSSKLDALFGI